MCNILIVNFITISCILNTCVTWQGMTKWLHTWAISEPSSGQFCSNDQLLHVENFVHYGIPYGITSYYDMIKRLLIVVCY
jgi:hypothetical protein